jgi:hypothetical protein
MGGNDRRMSDSGKMKILGEYGGILVQVRSTA